MDMEKIEEVNAEDLGEGYCIVDENGELSPVIDWVEWVQLSDDEDDVQIEVNFEDDSAKVFAKGCILRQIWHEDV